MKPIWCILFAVILSFTKWTICTFFYPLDEDSTPWDNVCHEVYLVRTMFILGAVFFHLDPKYVPLFHFLAWGLFGVLFIQFLDKLTGDTETFHWRDLIWIALSFYSGLRKALPIWHKKLGVGIITVITLGLGPSMKIYNWIMKKLV